MCENGENPTIFYYATKELTGSAFWAWLISRTYAEKNDQAIKKLASSYLTKIGVDPQKVADVRTEVTKPNRRRADIVVYDGNGKVLAIIENKLGDTLYAKDVIHQINGYAEGLDCKKVIMTWRYETWDQWKDMSDEEKKNITLLYLDYQIDLLASYKGDNDIARQYHIHAKEGQQYRDDRLKDVQQHLSKNLSLLAESLSLGYHDAQWLAMKTLTEGAREKLDNGINKGGSPWTQAGFNIRGNTFFYRMDRGRGGYYFRLNYWSDDKESPIVQRLRDSCKTHKLQVPGVHSVERLAMEATLWHIWFKDLTINAEEFNFALRDWHPKFVAAAKGIIP